MPVAGILGRRVSTHSRPKAAALTNGRLLNGRWFQHTAARRRLIISKFIPINRRSFNTQPPEGGCTASPSIKCEVIVSTHSRPKAAGLKNSKYRQYHGVSTHSRPKAAALAATDSLVLQSFQHTAARRRLVSVTACISPCAMFQHTAARRRLNRQRVDTQSDACFNTQPPEGGWQWRRCSHYRGRVSTHSRPKAAVMICAA